jgi:hypothetical protein
MIYTGVKYQGGTSLSNQCAYALKNEGQEGKTGPILEWVPVGWGRLNRE